MAETPIPTTARNLWPMRQALVPALAVALLTAVLLAMAQALLVDELAERALDAAQHRADDLAQQLDAELRSGVREVQLLARALRPGMAPDAARAELEHLRQRSDKFVWLGVVAMDGTVQVGTQGWLEGRSIATRPVFRQALQGSFVGDAHAAVALADLMASQGQGSQDLLDIGEPLRDAQGRIVGVLAAHLGVNWIEQLRRRVAGTHADAQHAVASVHVLTGHDHRRLAGGVRVPDGVPVQLSAPMRVRDLAGHRYFAAVQPLGGDAATALLPWRVLVLVPQDEALGPAHRIMQSMAALGVLAAGLVAVAGVWLSRRMLLPWGPLFDAVLKRSPAVQVPGSLAADVKAVVQELQQHAVGPPLTGAEALLLRLARDAVDLRRIVDQLPISLALIDAGFRVEYVNPAYTRLLGWTTAQVRGRIAAEFLFDAVERAEFVRQFDLLGDPPAEFGSRFFALTPGGERVPVQWHFVPLLDAAGTMVGAVAMLHDIRPELAARARADALAGRMRALADAALDDLLCTLDGDGRVIEWSRGAEHLTGLSPAATLGRPLPQVLGSGEPLEPLLVDARRAGRCAVSWRCALPDGRLRWLEGSVYPLGLAPGTARFGVILRDLSEQHAVHQALERSEAHMRLAVAAARIATWEIDLGDSAQPITWPEGLGTLFGAGPAPATREALFERVHPDDQGPVTTALDAAIRDAEPLRVEFRVRGLPGWRWHEMHGRAIRGADGRALRLTGIAIDITERKQAEAELQSGRERLERIVQTMAEGLVTLDAEGRYTMVNRAAERMVDAPAAQVVGRRYDEVAWRRVSIDGQVQGAETHPHPRLRRGAPANLGEIVCLQPPGLSERVISLNAQPVLDADGRFDGAVLTFVDITQRWQAEHALADNQARLAAVVEGASDAVISVDARGRISLFNPAAERIFGHAAAQVVGGPLDRLLPPRPIDHGTLLRSFASSGESRRAMGAGRVQGRHADGRALELEASISKVRVNGQLVLTAILRDVTERVAREKVLETTRSELAQLNHRLLEQEQETSRRLAQALHDELGQTLSALRLQWEAWRSTPEPVRSVTMSEQVCERVGQLVVTANRQIRTVMRDLRPPLLEELGLEAALDNELHQHRPLNDVPKLALTVPPRLRGCRWPPEVEYAAFMIGREALLNALQHAQAQHVEITLDGDGLELQLRVQDDGIGIAAEVRDGRAGHLGLVGMRERARAIGAALQWGGAAGVGTTVLLRWQADGGPGSTPGPAAG